LKPPAGSAPIPAQMKYDEKKVLAMLPAHVREQFLALDPAERRFILTASPAEREAYQEMPPEEQTRFALLPAALRGTYLKLDYPARQHARGLKEQDLPAFLSLSPEERAKRVSQSPEASAGRKRTARLAGDAARLAREVIDALSPWADSDPGLGETAGSKAFNCLHAGGDEKTARAEAMLAVLILPGPARALEAELGAQLGETALMRARLVLPEKVAALAREVQNREELISRLVESLQATGGKR
jgi:hypothetical protein